MESEFEDTGKSDKMIMSWNWKIFTRKHVLLEIYWIENLIIYISDEHMDFFSSSFSRRGSIIHLNQCMFIIKYVCFYNINVFNIILYKK